MREIFNRLRLPGVANQIGQQRHKGDSLVRAKLRQPTVRVDLNVTRAVHDRHPFRTQMGDQGRVFFQRSVAVRIAVGVKRETNFVRRCFLARFRGGRGSRSHTGQLLRSLFGGAEFLPKQRCRRDLTGRVRLLQGLELPLQLPQRKRNTHLGRNEQSLDKQHRA